MAEIAIAGAIAVLRQAVITLGKLVVHKDWSLDKLTEDLKWIENEMRYMRAYLEDADADADADADDVQGGSSAEATSPKNIRALAYDVEDVVETYFPQIATSHKGRKGCLGRLKIAKTARDFAGEIERIRGSVKKINRVITRTRRIKITKTKNIDTGDPRRSFPRIDEVNVVGLDEQTKELEAKVLDGDPQHCVVSIIGNAGLGKTTLAKKIFNSVAQSFECSAWIFASPQPNIEELLLDIARQVGLEKEKWERNIKNNLRAFLRDKRRGWGRLIKCWSSDRNSKRCSSSIPLLECTHVQRNENVVALAFAKLCGRKEEVPAAGASSIPAEDVNLPL